MKKRSKSITVLLAVLMLLSMLPTPLFAAEDTFTAVTEEGHTLTFKVLTEGPSYTVQLGNETSSAVVSKSPDSGNLTIPETVYYMDTPYKVTAIGFEALAYASMFTGNLTIPNTVTSIGGNAFIGCTGFTGSLTIPDTVKTIGWNAFSGCTGFSGSLTIPDGIETIEETAFYNCTGFTGSLTIPDSVKTIGWSAFSRCTGLNGKLIIGSGVERIEGYAFEACPKLDNVWFKGDKPTTLWYGNFDNCKKGDGGAPILMTLYYPENNITWDGYTYEGDDAINIVAYSSPAIATATLAGGTTGETYTAAIAATGTMPITWSIISGSLPDGLSLNSSSGAITGTPTKEGTYKFTVKVTNFVASATKEFSIVIAPATSRGGGNHRDHSTPAQPGNTGVEIFINGKSENMATSISSNEGGRSVTTIILDDKKVEERITREGSSAVVTIPVLNSSDVVVGQLNGQMVKNMEIKEAIFEIKTGQITYTLPAQQINIDAVSERFGQELKLSDIKVSIEIAKSLDETVKVVEDAASNGNFSIVVPPIDFTVKCAYGGQAINASEFSSYVERTVAIPDGVDPQKITTGVVVEPDGTVRHVPTKIIVVDGKYYARINSLTNSAYSVIWNPIEFKDTAVHWAKEAINDMGSRMVVNGVGNDAFEPDRDITRAEFAAIIVRALGLKPGLGQKMFSDVPADAWYSSYVTAASEYRIVSGYGDGRFGPNDKITREQAMVMIARAMNITELKVEFTSGEVEKVLEGYKAADKFADYAKNSIAACIKAGVVTGKNDKLIAPKDNITRAEVAVIIQRLLQKSNLI